MRCNRKPPQTENPKVISPQIPIRETRIGTMDRIKKLRRSAMSIADNAPFSFIKLHRRARHAAKPVTCAYEPRMFIGSGLFLRWFMGGLNIRDVCIESPWSSPSLPLEERAGERRPPTMAFECPLKGPSSSLFEFASNFLTSVVLLTEEVGFRISIFSSLRLYPLANNQRGQKQHHHSRYRRAVERRRGESLH